MCTVVCLLVGTYYDSVERYCPKKNQWRFVQPMTIERRAVCAAALDNYIYAAGKKVGWAISMA